MAASSVWHRFQQRRVSRRRLLRAGMAGAAGLAVAVAFKDGVLSAAGGRGAGAPGTPTHGGRFRTALTYAPDTLDPSLTYSDALAPHVYNVLVGTPITDPAAAFFDLAESYERPDETTWVYSIRPGVKIAPNTAGVPERNLNASDAYVAFQRIFSDPEASAHYFVSHWFQGHNPTDLQTYVVHTVAPYAYFLFQIGSPFTTIPPHELAGAGFSTVAGGGPFVLAPGDYGYAPQYVPLDRNPNYYRSDPAHSQAPLPYVDGWTMVVVPDRPPRRAAFEHQQIYSYTPATPQEADDLLGRYPVYAVERPFNTFISLTMNVKRPPWNDARVRKAAMYALNRQEYIDRIYNGHARANGLVHWPMGPFALSSEELDQLQPYDPAQARQLVLQATGAETVSINLLYPANSDIERHSEHLPIFLDQMRAAGFDIQLQPAEFTSWLQDYTNVNYDASLALNQIYDTPEIPLDFHHSRGPLRDGLYSHGVQDPAIDAAIESAKAVIDIDQLVETVHTLQRQIYDAGPAYLPLVSPFDQTLYWNFVKNISPPRKRVDLFSSDFWLAPELIGPIGDVTCDGRINSLDAAVLLQHDAGLLPTMPCASGADANADGRTNAIDGTLILQYDAGFLLNLPP